MYIRACIHVSKYSEKMTLFHETSCTYINTRFFSSKHLTKKNMPIYLLKSIKFAENCQNTGTQSWHKVTSLGQENLCRLRFETTSVGALRLYGVVFWNLLLYVSDRYSILVVTTIWNHAKWTLFIGALLEYLWTIGEQSAIFIGTNRWLDDPLWKWTYLDYHQHKRWRNFRIPLYWLH